MKILCRRDYEKQIADTRDERMKWWRDARFGMFVHYGLYTQLGQHEWAQTKGNIPVDEYAELAKTFAPKEGCCREWAALAKKAGMKYMVLTTRHHEGFSLWDSKVNPFNSVNYCGRDIVKEFVEACREFDLKIGFYSSLMDWHHPDAGIAAYDNEARQRFTKYIEDLNTELLTQYGKIDILWYDVPDPMESWEGWDSLARNQRLRALQPHIIINNRSHLPEDFGTPEEHVKAVDGRDWESCMTFNGMSWGYADSKQTAPYSYNQQKIITMLHTCVKGGGNLLLNIGPAPDGSVPEEAVEPLTKTGEWLKANGEVVYGAKPRYYDRYHPVNGSLVTAYDNIVYYWMRLWPTNGTIPIGGFQTAPKKITLLDGTPLDFEYKGQRIILKNLPLESPDKAAGITVIKIEFDSKPEYRFASYYPQLNGGQDIPDELKI